MRNTRHAITAAALLGVCLLGGGTAIAQGGPPMGRGNTTTMPMMQGPGYGAGYGMMQGYGMMSGAGMMPGWSMMDGHTAGMLAFLKAEIGVTAAQEPQWSKFATALGAMADSMHDGMHAGRAGTMMGDRSEVTPLPDMLAARVRWMDNHLAALKALQAAAGPFYAALDTGQKAKADALLGCGVCGR